MEFYVYKLPIRFFNVKKSVNLTAVFCVDKRLFYVMYSLDSRSN